MSKMCWERSYQLLQRSRLHHMLGVIGTMLRILLQVGCSETDASCGLRDRYCPRFLVFSRQYCSPISGEDAIGSCSCGQGASKPTPQLSPTNVLHLPVVNSRVEKHCAPTRYLRLVEN